jgi:tRNA(Ile2) C34 agmatinyltransferase TiaS
MAVYTGFTPSEELVAYGRNVKRGEIEPGVLGNLVDKNLQIILDGRGIIGAVAAIPFYTRYKEALELCSGRT